MSVFVRVGSQRPRPDNPVKKILLASLLLNVALGVFAVSRRTVEVPKAPVPPHAAQHPVAPTSSGPEAASDQSARLPGLPGATSDLPGFVEALKQAGASEMVVRALVAAVIHDKMAARRAAVLYPPGVPAWRFPDRRDAHIREQLEAIQAEGEAELQRLLGRAPLSEEARALKDWTAQRKYGELAMEKIAALEAGKTPPEQILTPQELAEYKIRNSPLAKRVSRALEGIQVTEAEYRQLYATLREGDARGDEAVRLRAGEQVLGLLGADRYEHYLRAVDPAFSATLALTVEHGLPRRAAYDVSAVRAEAESSIAAVRSSQLSADAKKSEIDRIRSKAQTSLRNTLGPVAAASYEKQAGAWLKHLTKQ